MIIRIIGVVVIIVLIVPMPISRTYTGLEIKVDDPAYAVPTEITVSGYYHLNIFSDDSFDGQITISGYPLSSHEMSTLYLFKDDSMLNGTLEYSYREEDVNTGELGERMRYCLGMTRSTRLLQDLFILVFSDPSGQKLDQAKSYGSWGSWATTDGYCIVPSVSTRDEALALLREYAIIN